MIDDIDKILFIFIDAEKEAGHWLVVLMLFFEM